MKTNQEVYFDSITHTYLMGDKILQGVTTLMRKHGLSTDYSGIPDHILKNAAERGTAVHKAIENYINGKSYEDCLVEAGDHYDFVANALKEYIKLKIPASTAEYLVSDNEMVATSIDIVMTDYSLADVKTTSQLDEESLRWQLSIGKFLFEKQTGIKVPHLYGIHIREKGKKIKVEPIPREEVERLFECEKNGTKYTQPKDVIVAKILQGSELIELIDLEKTYSELDAKLQKAKDERDEFRKRFYDLMKEHGVDKVEGENITITRTASYTKNNFNSKQLQKDDPKLYKKYLTTSNVKGSLRVTLKNKPKKLKS